jgi:hypothetical protein
MDLRDSHAFQAIAASSMVAVVSFPPDRDSNRHLASPQLLWHVVSLGNGVGLEQ